jgi:threonine dehydrogenase-like Zn-dependent dehydrogenase
MTGRVAVFKGPREALELREYVVPDPAPRDAVIRTHMANVCGSDLHMWDGSVKALDPKIPMVMGHEMIGHIDKLGSELRADTLGEPLREGDRVVCSFYRPCGRCWTCLTGYARCPTSCSHWINVSADQPPHFHGAFGDYFYMDGGHWIFKVPDGLPDQLASPTNCALSQVFDGLHRVGITVGDTVVVQGAGGLGLYASAIAQEMGAGQVIAIDRVPSRLELARAFGATETINVGEVPAEERIARVRELTAGRGADVVGEFVGSPAVLPEGFAMLRDGGRYLWIGNIALGKEVSFEPALALRPSISVVAIVGFRSWIMPRALDLIDRRRDRYPFDRIVSDIYPFEEVNEGLHAGHEGRAIRIGLDLGIDAG